MSSGSSSAPSGWPITHLPCGNGCGHAEADLLGGLQYRIRRVDLGEQSELHLLRVGPLADAEAAKALCDALSESDVDCLVVKP